MSRRRRSQAIVPDRVIPAANGVLTPPTGQRWLIVVRESAVKRAAFAQMVRKVVANLRYFQIPGLDAAERLGVQVFNSEDARATLDGLQELRRSSGRQGSAPYGYLFRIDGTWFLFAQVSARATTGNHDNDFTRDLANAVRNLRPTHLGTGPTSRLCRHRDHVSMLNLALENAGGPTTFVVCDDSEGRALNLRVNSDRETWDKACNDAVADYHATRRRLSGGIAGVLALGEWSLGEEALPAGYNFKDPHTFVVQPDPAWRAFVAEVIKVSAKDYTHESESDPRKEWARALEAVVAVCDRHQWKSEGLRRLHGKESKFSDARYPHKNAEKLWTYLPLWQNGKYEWRQKLTLGLGDHQQDYNGVALDRVRDKDGNTTTYMVKQLDFGTFDWTEEEQDLLRQAIARRSPEQRPKGDGGRKPNQTLENTDFFTLLGLSEFVDGQWQYRLARNNYESYRLLSRPVDDAYKQDGSRSGWLPGEGVSVATIQCMALHEGIAAAAVRLIDEGGIAPALTRLPLPLPGTDDLDRVAEYEAAAAELRSEIDKVARRASILRDQEIDARVEDNGAAADDYKAKANEADKNVTRLRGQLAALTPPEPGPAVLPSGTTADLGEVAVALAALARTESSGPLRLHEAISQIVVGLRFTAGVSAVTVSFSVRLPTSHGPVTLGPIAFTLPNTRRANKAARVDEMLNLFFMEGLSWAQIGARVTRTPQLAHGQVRKHLAATYPQLGSGARTAIMQCPIADTRRIVWHALTGSGSVTDLPKAWVAHVRGIYLGDVPLRRAWAANNVLRRKVLSYLLAHQSDPETGVSVWDAAKITGYAVDRITCLIDPISTTSGRSHQTSFERVDAEQWGTKRVTGKARLRARACPWCQTRTATHVLSVPECPDDLLCTTCSRMPSDPSVEFPKEYLEPWVGGHQTADEWNAGTTTATDVDVPVAWKMRRKRAS